MSDVAETLKAHLFSMAAPFLFVGAGMSRRYIGSDSWSGLLSHMAALTEFPFEYYVASADGNYPKIASDIAERFHEIWWTSEDYRDSRVQWSSHVSARESAFKVEVARSIAGTPAPSLDPVHLEEIELLRGVVIDGIITTNYDPFLEGVFPEYQVYVGQDDLIFAATQGVGEIYKIHGCVTRPESLVITGADYARFEERNAYLAAKLLTIFIEHPVIFLGYSLSDPNILGILREITSCLTQDNIGQLQDRLIFVQRDVDRPASVSPYVIMMEGIPLTVTRVSVQDFRAVFAVLSELKRPFPAQLLRRLKEQVYELVLSGDPNGRLYVADLDDESHSEDIEVVFGVGMAAAPSEAQLGGKGYTAITRWDIVEDVLSDGGGYDAHRMLTDVLPSVQGNFPVFKYLRRAGMLTDDGRIRDDVELPGRVRQMAEKIERGIPAGADYARRAKKILQNVDSISQLESTLGVEGVVNFGTCLPPEKVSIEELLIFLQSSKDLRDNQWGATQYVKLACMYDWLSNRFPV